MVAVSPLDIPIEQGRILKLSELMLLQRIMYLIVKVDWSRQALSIVILTSSLQAAVQTNSNSASKVYPIRRLPNKAEVSCQQSERHARLLLTS